MCPCTRSVPDCKLVTDAISCMMQATEDKNTAIAQAEKTATKAKLADRLINGLSGENKRWNETIHKFGIAEGARALLEHQTAATGYLSTCVPGCTACLPINKAR